MTQIGLQKEETLKMADDVLCGALTIKSIIIPEWDGCIVVPAFL